MKIPRTALLAMATAISAPAISAPAPPLHAQTLEALAPLPLPYDEKADAIAAVSAARARACSSGKLLLVDFVGNWCLDCLVHGSVMHQSAMLLLHQRHYAVVAV